MKEFYVQCRDVTDGFGADTIDARGTFVKAEVKFLPRIGRYLDMRFARNAAISRYGVNLQGIVFTIEFGKSIP